MPLRPDHSSMMDMRLDAMFQPPQPDAPCTHCPSCARPADADEQNCAGCGIWLAGPQAAELWWIEGELGRVDKARTRLVDRRNALLTELAQMRQMSDAVPSDAVPSEEVTSGFPPAQAGCEPVTRQSEPDQAPARPELSGRTTARLLLALGAVLVVIAAIAFAVANWSDIGPLGRCAILLGVTALVLAAPARLGRRALYATAESVAAIGLGLTIADAYLVLRLVGDQAGNPFVLAAMCAALAAMWAAYGLATHLKIPRVAAIAAAQLPGLIATAGLVRALGGTASALAGPIAVALVLTSGADLLLASWAAGAARRAEALTSSIAATAMWVAAVLVAAHEVGAGPSRPGGLWMSGTLVTAGAIGIGLLPRTAVAWIPAAPVAALSGALLAIGIALPAAGALPSGWEAAAFAVAGALVTGAALIRASRGPRPRMRLVAAGSALILGAAGLLEVPAASGAMFPLRRLVDVWSGQATTESGAALATPVVLALVSLACWLAPLSRQLWTRLAAVAVAGLAAGSVPAAAGLTGWAPLAVLTVAAAIMLAGGAGGAGGSWAPGRRASDRQDPDVAVLATAATLTGVALAASAVLWSLTWAPATITELAVLTLLFCLVAVRARETRAAQLGVGCALAAVTGLACALPLADGWPLRYASFAVLGVAVAAAGVATLLRGVRPAQALVLDLGAGPVVLLAAVMAVRQADTFAVLAAIAAIAASSTACLRASRRRVIALCGATCAALAAIAAQGPSLALALLSPFRQLATSWDGREQAAVSAVPSPGLALAVVVLGACAAAMVIAAGAWRGSRGSLDAAAAALPLVVAPAGLAGGLRYGLVTGLLLALALALTAWSSVSRSLVPAAAALAAASLALAWALVAPAPTLIVLGCLSLAYPLCAWRSRLAGVRVASACLSVLSVAAFAECAALAAGRPAWQAGLAVLGAGACAQAAAAWLASTRPDLPPPAEALLTAAGRARAVPVSAAIEAAGWLVVATGTSQCLGRPGPASLALAISGLLSISVAVRADRRPALWFGLALCEAAWCVWLAAAGVSAPEPYTVPAAAALLAYGVCHARRVPPPSSWLTDGPGLALLLLPSLAEMWQSHGWVRPLLLGIAAAGVTLIGGRLRRQAPLLIGAGVTVLAAGHALAPAFSRLAEALPSWLAIAVTGAILLWSGATYEARLRNLSSLRKSVAGMR